MNLRICTTIASVCMLVLAACGTDGTTGGTASGADTSTTTDTANLGDTVTTGDTGGKDAGDGASSGGNDTTDAGSASQCCKDKGAECGFVAGCPQSCGSCGTDKVCDTKAGATKNKCIAKTTGPAKKALGEACGPNKDCIEPGNNATDAEQQAYFQCLDDQCDSSMCWLGVCTKTCNIAADSKNNATGAAQSGGDGIEDPDAASECEGFKDGPAGNAFKCVQLLSAASAQQVYRCTPGTTFASCKANADCKDGEVCGYKYIRGVYALTCAPPYKEADGKPGQTVGAYCNDNASTGPLATCKNNICLGVGCVDFCKTDSDCNTAPGACQAGKCSNNGASCNADTDCSAFFCKKDQKFFGAENPAVNVCLPKPCYLDEDCKDPNYYCLSQYNGVKNQDGDPDPTDPTKVKMPGWNESACVKKAPGTAAKGAPCDDFPNDADTTVPACGNKYWCMNGTCGNHCNTDSNCAAGMKCGVIEIPLDTSDPQDDIDDVFTALKVCSPMPGATGTCSGSSQCTTGKSTYCRVIEVELPNPSTLTGKYTLEGQCIEPSAKQAAMGAACGSAVSKSCLSGFCLGTGTQNGEATPGWCADTCGAKSDCPAEVAVEIAQGQKYKTVCRALLYGNNATPDPLDNVYVPLCLLTGPSSSLADCSSDYKCASAIETCAPFGIATGADKPAKVEFRCIDVKGSAATAPTKKVGEACNPNPGDNDPEECASGMCMPDAATGKGYCSQLCKSDSECGSNDSMFCDTKHQVVARKDPSMAAFAPMCLKKKSCIPCAYDFQCSGEYKCTWTDTKATNGRCAPSCQNDADCAKTDGGGKCEDAKDFYGKLTGNKVCTPICK